MNYGSIHKPTTKEAQLFAFLRDNCGQWFGGFYLAQVLDQTTCLHSYIAGVRMQLLADESLGYRVEHRQEGRAKHFYRLVRVAVEAGKQMELIA